MNFHAIVEVLYAAAVLSGVAGLLNAGWTRIRWITVRLEPGSGDRLTLGMKRYANQPTAKQPWDQGRTE